MPGGKLELGEIPQQCVRREVQEELGIEVIIKGIIDSWVYHIRQGVDVLILSYDSKVVDPNANIVMSNEHKALKLFSFDEIPNLNMPDGYKHTIFQWQQINALF